MTRIYFVRHAQPKYEWEDDKSRPLTDEGIADTKLVLEFFKDKHIDVFYCSPYKRSIDTIVETAQYCGKEILKDERLRERGAGIGGNGHEMIKKRWADKDYHEEKGESIHMVQLRNIDALSEILKEQQDRNIIIGTHGTALSSILNYYDEIFNCDSFFRIIDWMPYIIELDFQGNKLIKTQEHLHIEKEWKL